MQIDHSRCSFCCGAIEIGGFGGGEHWMDESDELATKKELLAAINKTLRGAIKQGNSVVFATTMSNQPTAKAALEELGFYTCKPFRKTGGHDDRKMQAWFLPLSEYTKD